MNRLVFPPTGGIYMEKEDYEFMQDAFKEAIKGVLHKEALAKNGNIILSGCEVSIVGANYVFTEGFVMLNYEIMYVPAATKPTPQVLTNNDEYRIYPTVSYDNNGTEQKVDGGTFESYQVNQGIVIDINNDLYAPSSDFIKIFDTSNRIENIRKSQLGISLLEGDLSLLNSWNVVFQSTVKVVKKDDCLVFMKGKITGGTTQGSKVIATIATAFRPSENRSFVCWCSLNHYVNVVVKTNGEIEIEHQNSSATITIDLSLIKELK